MTKKLSDADKVVGVYYQLVELYNQWQKDREEIKKRWEAFTDISNEFNDSLDQVPDTLEEMSNAASGTLEEIGSMGERLEEKISIAVDRAFEQAKKEATYTLKALVEKKAYPLLDILKKQAITAKEQTDAMVDLTNSTISFKNGLMTIISMGCSVLTGILLGCIFYTYDMPHYDTYVFSNKQVARINRGAAIEAIWPSLSSEEKDQYNAWLKKGNAVIAKRENKKS